MFIPVTGVIRVWCNYVLGSRNMGSAFHIDWQASNPTLADVQGAVDLIDTWQEDWLSPLLSQDINLTYIEGTSLSSESAPQYRKDISPIRPGEVASSVLAGGTAAVITWKTALRGRSYRGRTYVCGIPESALASGLFDSTFVNGLTVAANQLYTACNGNDTPLCVVSRYHLGEPREVGVRTFVNTWAVNNRPDSQRRRNAI